MFRAIHGARRRYGLAQFEENLTKKLALADFTGDLARILSRAALAEFDREAAGEQVLNELVARLEGEPWQGRAAG